MTGWDESCPELTPPLFQRRVAAWLRHKLTPTLPPRHTCAAASTASGPKHQQQQQQVQAWQEYQQQEAATYVPLDGVQEPPQRSWAAVVSGGRSGPGQQLQQGGSQAHSAGGSSGRQVLHVSPGVQLLLCRSMAVPGPAAAGRSLRVELLDVSASRLSQAAGSNSSGGWGSNGSSSGSDSAGCLQGASGLLLLVSGPEPGELASAAARLRVVLERWPVGGPPVQLTVLACSGEAAAGAVK